MNKDSTKELITSTFFELLEKESLEKLNVKKICEACGINRNTFYYHFTDMYDVLDCLFKKEIDSVLAEPVTGIKEEYMLRARMLYKYKKILLHVYQKSPEILYKYLNTVCSNLVRKYVLAAAPDTPGLDEICRIYEYTVKGALLDWLAGGMNEPDEAEAVSFASFFEASLPALIRPVPLK